MAVKLWMIVARGLEPLKRWPHVRLGRPLWPMRAV